MKKIVWNKSHGWKIIKNYRKDKLCSFEFRGDTYIPIKDYIGLGIDERGERYIAGDACCNCPLDKYCKAFNPINEACEEFNMNLMRMELE